MLDELNSIMIRQQGWPSILSYWDEEYKNLKIVSEFMKNPTLGSKRLVSMPDRVTNMSNIVDVDKPVCRPTDINIYKGDLGTIDKWLKKLGEFMFVKKLNFLSDEGAKTPSEMLLPIMQIKYPDITEEEEAANLPLQTMPLAIFDAILVHMMNTVSLSDVWQPIKSTMVNALNRNKVPVI